VVCVPVDQEEVSQSVSQSVYQGYHLPVGTGQLGLVVPSKKSELTTAGLYKIIRIKVNPGCQTGPSKFQFMAQCDVGLNGRSGRLSGTI